MKQSCSISKNGRRVANHPININILVFILLLILVVTRIKQYNGKQVKGYLDELPPSGRHKNGKIPSWKARHRDGKRGNNRIGLISDDCLAYGTTKLSTINIALVVGSVPGL